MKLDSLLAEIKRLNEKVDKLSPTAPAPIKWLTVEEFQQAAHYKTRNTVYNKIWKGEIHRTKFGKRCYIHPDELNRLITESFVTSNPI